MHNRRSLGLVTQTDHIAGAAVLGLLLTVYLLTASLTFISGDELFLYDTTESFARRGSVMRNETADLDWPGHTYVEPMQPLLSVPIFLIADQIDQVGNAHATLLFNAVVTAATGSLLVLYVRRLGYSQGVSVTVALLYGLTTIAWPYSKNYFREPLGALALFGAAYCLLRWRQAMSGNLPLPHFWLALATICGAVSILAKESGVVGMPILLLILLTGRRGLRNRRSEWLRTSLLVSVLFGIALAGLYLYTRVLGAAVFRFDPISQISAAYANLVNYSVALEAIFGFMLSPGKGVFWYSPILLLALSAPWLAGKRWLDTSWPIILLVTFVVVYAFVREYMWFGGTNWGPRYLMPTTPFLMLGVAPAVHRAQSGSRLGFCWLSVAVLALVGFVVQVGGVSVNPLDYYKVLEETGISGAAWTVALWSIDYSAILGHWRLLLAGNPLDFAWAQVSPNGVDWLMAGALLMLAGGFAWLLLRLQRHPGRRAVNLGFLILGGFLLVYCIWISLRRVYPDQRFRGDNQALHAMRISLQESNLPDSVVFLNNRTYFDFMLNYYKGSAVWYTLELNQNELIPPGKRYPDPNTDPFELLNEEAWSRVDYFARQHRTAVLLMETGPYDSNVVRAMEWWMNTEFHRIRTQEFSNNVRLVEYSSVTAPERDQQPEYRLDLVLSDKIALIGHDPQPPAGLASPASVLNLSTQWMCLKDLENNYIIGTYLMTPQGTIAVQDDSTPVGGFWPTSTWREGDIIRHNVALVLPSDLAPGHYEVWTLMYSPLDGSRLPVSDTTGTYIRDHVVLYSVEVTR